MKRKSLLLTLLLCFSAGFSSMWAQDTFKPKVAVTPKAGGKYAIYDAFYSGQDRRALRYAAVDQNGVQSKHSESPTTEELGDNYVWIAEKYGTSEKLAFKNAQTGKYFNDNMSEAPVYWNVVGVENASALGGLWKNGTNYDNQKCFVVYKDGGGNCCWNGNPAGSNYGFSMWSDGHPYQFYTADAQTVNVTYKCIDNNGTSLKEDVVPAVVGETYTFVLPTIPFYQFASKTVNGVESSDPSIEITEDTKEVTVICTYDSHLPFEVTNITSDMKEFPADAKFYKMTIHSAKRNIEYDSNNPDKIAIPMAHHDYPGIVPDSALWCFTGNVADGFQIYNRATGTQMLLDFEGNPNEDGNSGGNTAVHMMERNSDNTTWALLSGAFDNGFFFAEKRYGNYKMNHRTDGIKGLAFWTGSADAGSTFTFEDYDINNAYVNGLRGLLKTVADRITTDAANIGNPGFTGQEDFDELETAYNTILTDTAGIAEWKNNAKTYYETMNAAFNTYKGKVLGIQPYVAYFMTNTKGRGSVYYNPSASDIFVWSSAKAGAAKPDSLNSCWIFVPNGEDGQYYLYNLGRRQFVRYANDNQSEKSWRFTAIPTAVTIAPNQDGFEIKATDGSGFSISTGFDHPVITYYGATDAGVPFALKTKGNASDEEKATIEQILANGQNAGLTDVWAAPGTLVTGANAKEAVLVRAVTVASAEKPATLKGMTVKLSNSPAVKSLKVYSTTTPTWSAENTMLGETSTIAGNEVTVPFEGEIQVTDAPSYIWVVAEMSSIPQAGDMLSTSVVSMNYSAEGAENATLEATNSDLMSTANLFDAQTTIFNRGTLDSKFFGSPAIAKAPNGDLIAVTDVRYDNASGLGNHKMDIAASISNDNGATWSDPVIIQAGDGETEDGFGYSSPCIAVDTVNAKIYILISGGKTAAATNKNLYVLTSEDNGVSWTKSEKLAPTWEPTVEGDYTYLGSIAGSGVVLSAQAEGADIANGTPVFPVKTNTGTYTLYKHSADGWTLSADPVFANVQNATVQETSTGNLVFTASTVAEDGARLMNKWDQSMLIDGLMTFDDPTPMEITGTGDAAGLALLTKEGTTILTNIALNTSKLILYGSEDNCETWNGEYTQDIQAKDAKESAIAAGNDNSVSIFYQTRVLGSETIDYILTCIKVPYSKIGPVKINNTDSDKVQDAKNVKVYDLQGRQVTPTTKGIYISKGKKVVIK